MLPPLSALRCFYVASRSENFSVAADTLRLTPSAVSHQIKSLEYFLGQPLFLRNQRRVQLTEAGKSYAKRIGVVFQEIEQATEEFLAASEHARLLVRAPPSLANSWLVPHLAEFIRRYPNIEIQILTDQIAGGKTANCEIRYGQGKWPGMNAEMLWIDRLYPMVNPASHKISSIEDLANVPLIHTRSRLHGWSDFFSAHNLKKDAHQIGLEFDRSVLTLEAAVSGLGVVLESKLLARRFLNEGLLTVPLPETSIEDESYYFVAGRGQLSEAAKLFKEWLLEHLPV